MKIQIMFKTPDAVDYAIEGLTDEEKEEVREVIKKFVQYGECCRIEIDTSNDTAHVIPVRAALKICRMLILERNNSGHPR